VQVTKKRASSREPSSEQAGTFMRKADNISGYDLMYTVQLPFTRYEDPRIYTGEAGSKIAYPMSGIPGARVRNLTRDEGSQTPERGGARLKIFDFSPIFAYFPRIFAPALPR
jgi:hypothetical protein